MFDVITIGDATLDTFVVIDEKTTGSRIDKQKKCLHLNYGEKIPILRTAQSVGGNAANIAVGTRKLGLRSAIVTELGDDINGYVIAHELSQARVDTRFVKTIRGKETRYSVVLNYEAERTVLSYYAKRRYTLPKLPSTQWVYYTSLGGSFTSVQQKLLTYLKKHPDTNLAMNPGSFQLSKGLSTIKKMLPHVAVLFVNKEEAARLLGRMSAIKTMAAKLHRLGVKTVAITDSIRGSYASGGDGVFHMPIYPMKPLAKTGAGDAYASGFLSALHHGNDVAVAMQWGTANAAGVTTAYGAQKGLLTKQKIQSLTKKYSRIKPQLV